MVHIKFYRYKKIRAFWANTSANSLVDKLIREAGHSIKEQFELLLHGESIRSVIDEQIVYNQLNGSERAIWSLLLASGYLKVLYYEKYEEIPEGAQPKYELALTKIQWRQRWHRLRKNAMLKI
jgi:hypothetical protein